ncbi:acetyltransferase, GNAT family, partial [Burkholderia mallei GB8 horse 4]
RFSGAIWPVNPKYGELNGHKVYPYVDQLPSAPSVALICTPPATWPGIVRKLGGLGVRAAIIVGEARSGADRAALERALAAAKPYLLRVVGPGSLGVVSPALGAHFGAPACIVKAGGVAWVSQSNALTNAVLGWAHARGLGFSHAVALGGEADVDAADVLDYLASDAETRAILLELDTVKSARKFMSAARAAARNKPVLALRAGRGDSGDLLYTAAFQRAGMVRVDALDDLLDEIEALGVGRAAATSGGVTLVTSDRGVAKLAVDALAAAGETLAQWPRAAVDEVGGALPAGIVAGNPLLLGDDARPEYFGAALKALAQHPPTGTVFVVHATSHSAPAVDVARVLIESRKFARRGMLACFFGGVDAATRDALHVHGIPVHTTPQRLARAHARLVDYQLGRELLMQTPEGTPPQPAASISAARHTARAALAQGRDGFEGDAALEWLAGFGIERATDADVDMGDTIVDITVGMYDDPNFGPVFRYSVPPAGWRVRAVRRLRAAAFQYRARARGRRAIAVCASRAARAASAGTDRAFAGGVRCARNRRDVARAARAAHTRGRAWAAHQARDGAQPARDRAISALSRAAARLARRTHHGASDSPRGRGRASRAAERDDAGRSANALLRCDTQLRPFADRADDADRLRPRDGADRDARRCRRPRAYARRGARGDRSGQRSDGVRDRGAA